MCGIAPNGVSVFRKAGNADAEQIYSLGGPCPLDITSTSTASAAGNSGSVRVDAAITGVHHLWQFCDAMTKADPVCVSGPTTHHTNSVDWYSLSSIVADVHVQNTTTILHSSI